MMALTASSKRPICASVSGAPVTSAEAKCVNKPSRNTYSAALMVVAKAPISPAHRPSRPMPVSIFRCTASRQLRMSRNVVVEGAKVVLKCGERTLRPCGAQEPFLDVGIIKHRENKQDWPQQPPFHAEKSSGGWGYLLLVPGTLKTALIAAYLLGKSDVRVGTC